MKTLFRLLELLFVAGGWVLAGASLHVVRTPGPIPKVGMIHFVPKAGLTYAETWLDTTNWTPADLDSHSAFKRRLEDAGKLDWLKHIDGATAAAK